MELLFGFIVLLVIMVTIFYSNNKIKKDLSKKGCYHCGNSDCVTCTFDKREEVVFVKEEYNPCDQWEENSPCGYDPECGNCGPVPCVGDQCYAGKQK